MTVVVLNGTSSSGKTSIAESFQELRALAGECWVIVGIDDYLPKLPARWRGYPGHEGAMAADGALVRRVGATAVFEFGATGRRMITAYRRSVRAIASAGLDVLVDEVMWDDGGWDEWQAVLRGVDVRWVAVRCDPQVVDSREAARADRFVGLARGQAAVVHRHAVYDLELDSTVVPAERLAARLDDFLRHGR
jgi:chloramphenicol 3-O phosphotransferase